jgi:hypothetical protein
MSPQYLARRIAEAYHQGDIETADELAVELDERTEWK